MDLRRLIEALHASRHPSEDRAITVVNCPFHDGRAFEQEAKTIAWLIRVGIGRRP